MKKFLFYIAVTGWLLGLIVNLLSLMDFDVTDKVPFIWILHVGIFVVWIPVILDLRKNAELKEFQQSNKLTKLKSITGLKIFKNTPKGLAIIAIAGTLYAGINFIFFMTSQHGSPGIKDGQYVLQNHGHLIKTLTEQEYHHYKANEVRGFSGHWIAFYGIAMAILFPFKKQIADASSQNQ